MKQSHPAIEQLRAFFHEMSQWEISATKVADELSIHSERLKKELRALQGKYCTEKAKMRSFDFSDPPTYWDTVIDEAEETGNSKVSFSTHTKSLNDKYMYILIKKGDEWKLSDRFFLDFEGNAMKVSF